MMTKLAKTWAMQLTKTSYHGKRKTKNISAMMSNAAIMQSKSDYQHKTYKQTSI